VIDGIARSTAVIVAVCGQLDADRFDLESTSRAVVLVLAQPDIASACDGFFTDSCRKWLESAVDLMIPLRKHGSSESKPPEFRR